MEIYNKKTESRGVSLIEILTAIAIFSIFIASISGLFISAIQAQRRVLASQELFNQLSYLMEYISRSLRMAVKDKDGTCITTAGRNYEVIDEVVGDTITFLRYDEATGDIICQSFFLNSASGQIEEKKSTDKTSINFPIDGVALTNHLIINSFIIILSGDGNESPNLQPNVTIFLDVEGKEMGGIRPRIKIQTSVSERSLDTKG